MTPRVALTIAGSDSGGGAGLQADLKTFAAHGVFGTSAISAVTAQNTLGVTGVVALEPDFVISQIEAVLDDLCPDAVKTGMLANTSIAGAVGSLAQAGRLSPLVVDPVFVSTTGQRLMEEAGLYVYKGELLPCATIVTPNLWEAAVLTDRDISELASVDAMVEAARAILALGPTSVVVKGGHLDLARGHRGSPDPSPDVFVDAKGPVVLEAERVSTVNDHGTGCSMSAAIAARLALGAAPLDAVRGAKEFVRRALEGASAWTLGSGRGAIDHFGWEPAETYGPQESPRLAQ
ncbi:MAG: bifunctional hydroxymethylpyrimidine kinase/phosphomethylpyrimidine kinase [Acidimicrobiales bacterium]